MTYIANHYLQHDQEFYSLVVPYSEIKKSAYVMEYGTHELGYQRKLDANHVKNIKNTLIKDREILPTSIILSIDKEDLRKVTINELPISKDFPGNNFCEVSFPNEKLFRIVDGQHRLAGLRAASEEDASFNNYNLNVVILVTNTGNSSLEVEIFRDINSKAKKLKTDLTQLSLYNHRLKDKKKIEDLDELVEHLSIRVAHFINESSDEYVKFKNNPWINGIIFDIHDPKPLGIIGISAFIKSINSIIKNYIENENTLKKLINKDLTENRSSDIKKDLDDHAVIISEIIIKAWEYVKIIWKECFEESIITEDNQITIYYYKKDCYLQKTTGVNAIHRLLDANLNYKELVEEGTNELKEFNFIIKNSQVKSEHWILGGLFSGMTSQSGFKKAVGYIKNEIPIFNMSK